MTHKSNIEDVRALAANLEMLSTGTSWQTDGEDADTVTTGVFATASVQPAASYYATGPSSHDNAEATGLGFSLVESASALGEEDRELEDGGSEAAETQDVEAKAEQQPSEGDEDEDEDELTLEEQIFGRDSDSELSD